MQAWLQIDDRGREYLVRTGTGLVTALVPVGVVAPDGRHAFWRVEIYCDAPPGRAAAVRFSTHPLVAAEGPLFEAAEAALREVWPVVWSAQWHRHEWIPAELPITALDLSNDARCLLVALDRVDLPEVVDAPVPDFLPAVWAIDGTTGESP